MRTSQRFEHPNCERRVTGSDPWRIAALHARHVFHDRESLGAGAVERSRPAEREGLVRGADLGAMTRRVRRGESVEQVRRDRAGLTAIADFAGIFGDALIGTTNDRSRRAARRKPGPELKADHDRDRERQNLEDDLRRDDGLHEVVGRPETALR